jgi:putative phosphoesterase
MRKQPTIVAVIADTHIKHLDELPSGLMSALASADMVIHLGDYDSKELLDDLRKLNNFYGIAGNHDDKLLRRELKGMEVLEVAGKRLGLFHGFFIPLAVQKRMKAVFKKHKIDALLYGHTHFAMSKSIDDVFMFNPGSVTGHFPANYASFGLLTLDGSISGEIVPLEGTHNAARSYLVQLVAVLFQKAMRRLETWPYPDFYQYTADTRLALRKSFLGLKELLFWERGRNNFSPSKQ